MGAHPSSSPPSSALKLMVISAARESVTCALGTGWSTNKRVPRLELGTVLPRRVGCTAESRMRKLFRQSLHEAGRSHRWTCALRKLEAEALIHGAGESGRSRTVEAFEQLFKKRGLYPVGFQ